MKMFFASAILLLLLTGCFSVSRPPVVNWTVSHDASAVASDRKSEAPKYGTVRISQIAVRSPYDARQMAVLRDDGSIAFDPLNEFAATPALLLKGAVQDAVSASGKFKNVISSISSVRTDLSLEVTFSRLNFDARDDEGLKVVAEVSALLVDHWQIAGVANGKAQVKVEGGDFGAAYSKAVSIAVESALRQL